MTKRFWFAVMAVPSMSILHALDAEMPAVIDAKPHFSITNQLLYQLSYAGVYQGKYSSMRLQRVSFYTPFLYGNI
jgi:hypothetical protein